jgi:hypothetical protein
MVSVSGYLLAFSMSFSLFPKPSLLTVYIAGIKYLGAHRHDTFDQPHHHLVREQHLNTLVSPHSQHLHARK